MEGAGRLCCRGYICVFLFVFSQLTGAAEGSGCKFHPDWDKEGLDPVCEVGAKTLHTNCVEMERDCCLETSATARLHILSQL